MDVIILQGLVSNQVVICMKIKRWQNLHMHRIKMIYSLSLSLSMYKLQIIWTAFINVLKPK